jgi:uncharacterized protein (TIGR03437 family)
VRIISPVLSLAIWSGLANGVVQAQPKITEYTLPTVGAGASAIARGSDGNLWLTETTVGKIAMVTPTGAITEFSIPTRDAQPRGIVAGPDGNLWFTEYGSGKIGRITPAGAITEFGLPQSTSGPSSIAPGADGALWFTESLLDKIGRVTTAGAVTEYSLPAGSTPLGIAAGPDGNMWFTEAGANQVGRITTAGLIDHYALVPILAAQSGLAPGSIVSGPQGRLWFTTTGGIWSITTSGEPAQYPMPDRGARPTDIAIAADGSLWYTESTKSKVGRLSPEGVLVDWATPTANAAPAGIVAGPDGNLWFIENTGNRVGVAIPPAGSVAALLTLSRSSLSFTTWAGGPVPASQVLSVTATRATPFTATVSVAISYGRSWLTVSPSGLLITDQMLTVSVDATNIGTYGAYPGAILLTAGDLTQIVPVTMNITKPPKTGNVTVSPTSLSFTYALQGSAPDPQLLRILDATPGVSFTPVTISTTTLSPPNGRWLTITTAGGGTIPNGGSGTGQMSIQAVIDPVGLGVGVYEATITIAPTGGDPVRVPVTLTVVPQAQAPVSAAPTTVLFTWELGTPAPASQTVRLTLDNAKDSFTTEYTTADWMSVTPRTGTGSTTLTVSVQPAGLVAGTFRNRVNVSLGRFGASAWFDVVVNVVAPQSRVQEFPIVTGATPIMLAKGPDGAMWVTQQNPHSLGRIGPDGTVTDFPTSLLPFGAPFGIASGPDGALWFTEQSASIGRLALNGEVRHFPLRIAASPRGITAGPDGNMWFADQRYSICRITPTGEVTEYVPPSHGTVQYIVAGPDGNLWFLADNSTIGKITTDGHITEYHIPDGSALGITAGPDGNVWFTLPLVAKIAKITPEGIITAYRSANWWDPRMITAGPDGNLWFTDSGPGKIGRITTSGVITEYEIPTFVAEPFGIAAGADGNIWFTEIRAKQIGRVLLSSQQPSILSIGNAASYQGPDVAPGEIVTISGSDLGPANPLGVTLDNDGKVATAAGGVTVTFNGRPAPLLYVSATQINCVVPYEVAGQGNIEVKLTYAGRSAARRVNVAAAIPAVFTADGSGKGQGAITNAGGGQNSVANPAAAGDVVILYVTGEGQTNPASVTGAVTVASLGSSGPVTPRPVLPVIVYIGGKTATLEFVGEAPAMVAGVLQINARIPSGIASGNLPLVVTLGTSVSQSGVTVAVK